MPHRSRALAIGLAGFAISLARPAIAAPQSAQSPTAAISLKPAHTPLSNADVDAFVSGAIDSEMRQDHVAGVSVAVVQDGRLLLLRGYGSASRTHWRPVGGDTPFRLGSISKTFTWVALMREVEKGRVRLDDPVNQYLPPAQRIPNQGFKQPIRVRDLMSHTVGMEDLEFGQLMARDPAKVTTTGRYLADHRPNRVREPGADPTYCNYCAVLAGYIVSRLEGADYETVVERDIAAPLGMSATTFRDPRPARSGLPAPMDPALAARTSDGFSWSDGDFKTMPVELTGQIAPAGAGWSSAADMSRYMIMLLNDGVANGARIFGPSTAKAFRTPLLATAPGVNGWDHGFIQWPVAGGLAAYGHGGDSILFHSSMTLVPELGLGIFIATNTEGGGKLANALPELMIQHFYGQSDPAAQAPAKIDAAGLRPYAGTYVSTRRAYHGLEQFIDLLQTDTVSAGPGGLVLDDQTWVPAGRPGFFRLKDGERLMSFDLRDGKAVRWRSSYNTGQHERAKWWQAMGPFALALGLTLIAAVATLAGLCVRRRDSPRSRAQALAGLGQTGAAIAWLTSITSLGAWAATSANNDSLMFGWPGPFLTVFVWSGLAASVLTLIGGGLLVPVWSGTGWSAWRKLRYSMTTALFVVAALVIGLRGGLEFWSL